VLNHVTERGECRLGQRHRFDRHQHHRSPMLLHYLEGWLELAQDCLEPVLAEVKTHLT
jgi:hypothetical protein